MRRTTFWLWLTGGVLGGATLVIFGGWWALRQWPEVVGPRLPPSIAYAIADWGPEETSAAQCCFGDYSQYWSDHGMTPSMADARNAVLCAELRGSREQQMAVLDFIGMRNHPGALTGFVDASPERDALVFDLTSSPDQIVREKARLCWIRNGPHPFTTIRWISLPDSDDRSPLSPDGWTTSRTGACAWQMMILVHANYDHLTPNKYKTHMKSLLDQVMAATENGSTMEDLRTYAIGLLAITESFAMTNDPLLKPAVERGLATLLTDPARLERLWLDDTTSAVLTTAILESLQISGIASDRLKAALSTGLDAWLATRDGTGIPPWFAHGKPVAATTLERWAALTICLHRLGREPTAPATPPAGIGDPHDSTPFGRYLIRLVSRSFPGNSTWDRVFDQRTETLQARRLITPDHRPPEGSWSATPKVSNRWETTFALLELCIDRYR